MNKDNLYDNTLEDLVKYYGECCVEWDTPTADISFFCGDNEHEPQKVLEVILNKFERKA